MVIRVCRHCGTEIVGGGPGRPSEWCQKQECYDAREQHHWTAYRARHPEAAAKNNRKWREGKRQRAEDTTPDFSI